MQKRQFAIVDWDSSDATWRIADCYLQLGWNGWQRETARVAFYAKFVIPTGTNLDKAWAAYTFNNVVGNGNHWEGGIGANAQIKIREKDDSLLRADLDLCVSRAIGSTQYRTFDLITGPLTRYGMTKIFNTFDDLTGYTGKTIWAADATTQAINVFIPVKCEFVLNLVNQYRQHECNVGYSFKGQQAEETDSYLSTPKGNFYGFSGLCSVQTPKANTKQTYTTNEYVTNYVSPRSIDFRV